MEGGGLWNEVGFHRVLHQLGLVDFFLEQQAAEFAQMQQADHGVGVAVIHRQTGVLAGSQGGKDVVHVILQINAHHLVARHHDVFHGDGFQIQDIEQHFLVAFRNQSSRFIHHRT